MPFRRPMPTHFLNKVHRATLLQSCFNHYREAAKKDMVLRS
jgi:hypothetical protein